MSIRNIFELLIFLTLLTFFSSLFASYMDKVFKGHKTILDVFLKPIENFIYKICKINTKEQQNWKSYFYKLLLFSFISLLFTFLVIQLQYYLPLNPEKIKAPNFFTNLNISSSFLTNTNLQVYKPEVTLSYFSQMVALTLQNFLSPAVGFCTALVLIRAFKNKACETIGNFYQDLIKMLLYVLLPLSIFLSIIFVFEGVPQNFQKYKKIQTLEHFDQTIIGGPIASQEAIKIIGSNGGGFTNANSCHPFENPTPFSNYLQIFFIMFIPAVQFFFYGKQIKNVKHSYSIYSSMIIYFVLTFLININFDFEPSKIIRENKVDTYFGNFEGKETRLNIFESSLFTIATTTVSNGATNCSLDSLNPIAGLMAMLNIELGEIVFGGIGSGLYSMILFILLSIFLCGLIIGRTPEYLGKKIEGTDVRYIMLALMSFILVILAFSAISILLPSALKGISVKGSHGLSQILYVFSSAAGNNGSAFNGLDTTLPWYTITTTFAMLLGRFFIMFFIFLLAKNIAVKKKTFEKVSFPITGPIFCFVLFGTILLIGALTFLPAIVMGPILERLNFLNGIYY
ncbi:MAG: potassium-transporting ATPase subunit A [Chlamydiae bacterium RIFCSPHIGHO2_12_FULL_27_8]|nr:MAG: potassium-transporting ATPase subunit A [Chlamydiae bacterium RIFCSPHIGHO2_12_FULL_27_8]OGN66387.1 MAG: potassium-transporting ATPase subunit A [Chlamydiae bacterium RIFCSPLOWO2_01_FULL_28_7]